MLIACSENGDRYSAWLADKSLAPFFCPVCNEAVILKKGRVVQHHFSHKPQTTCHYSSGESTLHYQVKREIFEVFAKHPFCENAELEKTLEGVRPDVYAEINDSPVAIEVQKSVLEIEELIQQAKRYPRLGIKVL